MRDGPVGGPATLTPAAISCGGWLATTLVLLAALATGPAAGAGETAEQAPSGTSNPPLTRASEVSQLTVTEATRRLPVRLAGTVVYSDPAWSALFVTDRSGTTFVDPLDMALVPPSGAVVEIEGKTGVMGAFPGVAPSRLSETGRQALPPARMTLANLVPRSSAFDWVEVQGIVRTQSESRGHTILGLRVGGQRLEVLISESSAGREASPVVDAEVALTGVIEWEHMGLHLPRLWVSSWNQVRVTKPPRARDQMPLTTTAEARRLAAGPPSPHRVRIHGRLTERHSDLEFRLGDESGTIDIQVQSYLYMVADLGVEVLGFLERGVDTPHLADAEVLVVDMPDALDLPWDPAPTEEATPPLRRIADIRALSSDESVRGLPVAITAVVTLFDPVADLLFVQDDTGALFVDPMHVELSLRSGQRVQISGRTAPGALAPIIVDPRVEVLAEGALPDASAITPSRLATGECDCRLVEVRGRVRRAERGAGAPILEFDSAGHRFRVQVVDPSAELIPEQLVGARARLRGVCTTVFDWHLRFNRVELRLPSLDGVQIEQPPEDVPPLRAISDILRPAPDAPVAPRVRVRGEVLLQSPRHGVFVRGDGGTLEIEDWESPPLHPGDRVEAVGFAAPGPRAPRLEDAQLRIIGRGPDPEPVALTIGRVLGESHSGDLVRLTAALIDSVSTADGTILLLRSGERVFEARLESEAAVPGFADLEHGSLLEVTGVALTDMEAVRGPSALVLLRSAADVGVLRRPPWWTPARGSAVAALLMAAALVALLWGTTLRRRVRRQTEEIRSRLREARDSEARYRGLFDAAGDGILILRDGAIVSCNDKALDIFRSRESDLVGRTLWDLSPVVQPDGRVSHETLQTFLEAVKGGERPHLEWRHLRPEGSALDAEIGLSPVELSGDAHVQAIVRDITARKVTENELVRLAAAVEHADEDVVITDPKGLILYVNPAFERITGYARAEVLGRNPRLLQSGEHDAAFYRGLWRTLGAGQTWRGRFKNRRKDGEIILQDTRISPIPDGAGGTLGYVAVSRDVTREVEAARHVAEMRKMDALGTLAGGIAHDFNNILFAILSHVELARRSAEPDSKLGQRLDAVRDGVTRAADLTRQILAFSRRGTRELRPTEVAAVAEEVLHLLRASLPATIEIRKELASQRAVMADASQIHQVLMNLGVNAGLAMRDAGGVLEVRVEDVVVDEEEATRLPELALGRYVRLSVEDAGVGMAPEVLSRAFEPFYTTRAQGEGTGMGLAVVHGIVLRHGGAITADSAPGRGTRFEVYLPALETDAGSSDAADRAPPGGTEHILLVDDEEVLRTVIGEMLEELGYRVTCCGDGQEALAKLRRDPADVDLLLSDLTMPDVTGDVLTRQALAVRPGLKVLLSTGHGGEWTVEQARALGAHDLLLKPIPFESLARAVRAALDGRPVGG